MISPKKVKRKIPTTMFTQHPDHSKKPFWADDTSITTEQEVEESYVCFSELGAPEIKWDWEGKLVDESFLEKLLAIHYDYFKENQIGLDKFVTFRLPNPRVQTEFRLGRAFMGLISAASLTEKSELKSPPMFEVILPMTETADEMIEIQEAFKELNGLEHKLYKHHTNGLDHIEMIPLIEEIHSIMDADNLLRRYFELHEAKFGSTPEYLRPYIARSDPALNAGIVPTVLAIKVALSKFRKLEEESGIELFPMLGCAALPFRGGLTPLNIEDFVQEYRGMKTLTIQSAFRYDYEKEDVIKAIKQLDDLLPKHSARLIDDETEAIIKNIISKFEKNYKTTIEQEEVAKLINAIASNVPKRRERVLHVGLFGYSRGVGKVTLPRAIKFTGSLYSIGIPPELIGTGRGLNLLESEQEKEALKEYYINFIKDMKRAGSYLNKEVLHNLAESKIEWLGVLEDVKYIEEFIGEELGPQDKEQKQHMALTSEIYKRFVNGGEIEGLIEEAAVLRRSIG